MVHPATDPMVGCVIVHNDKMIAEGYHRRYGEAHAEVNAIAQVQDESLLAECTAYVTLEPCSHYGKTPPCCDLIIAKGIKQVVVGMVDPNPKVSGRGIERMRAAGIQVEVGVMEEACRRVNRRFITAQTLHRPYVMLKWAQSADGYIDLLRSNNSTPPVRISNDITKTLNHQIRTQEGAIMVATNTAMLDNPRLTAEKWSGDNPLRVLLDASLRVPRDYNIFNEEAATLVINTQVERREKNIEYARINFQEPIVPQILELLHRRSINSLIVEGGTQLLNTFIESNLWDECRIETAPILLHDGVKAPVIDGTWIGTEQVDNNIMTYFKNHNNTLI